MSKKDEFINYVEKLIESDNGTTKMNQDAEMYWTALKIKEEKERSQFTENGKLILNYMKSNDDEVPRKSKDIAEAIGISSRSVAGAMRKLVTDNFVEKMGESPATYIITDDGRNIIID